MDEHHIKTGLTLAGKFYRGRDEWIWHLTADPEISPMAKAVGCYLAVRINKNTRYAFPQQTTIAMEMNKSRATIMRAVCELVDAGWLEKVQGRRGKNNAVNQYSLNPVWLSK